MRYLALLLVFLAACSSATAPTEPQFEQTPVPYDSPVLTQVWAKTEACSGIRGDFTQVHFYTVPAGRVVVDHQSYWGYWVQNGNMIVMGSGFTTNEGALMHEMVHALLQRGDHPAPYFTGKCGNLMGS